MHKKKSNINRRRNKKFIDKKSWLFFFNKKKKISNEFLLMKCRSWSNEMSSKTGVNLLTIWIMIHGKKYIYTLSREEMEKKTDRYFFFFLFKIFFSRRWKFETASPCQRHLNPWHSQFSNSLYHPPPQLYSLYTHIPCMKKKKVHRPFFFHPPL